MVNIDLKKIIVSLFAPFAAGIIGASVTTRSLFTWYASLVKPFFSPPDRAFGIVWPILYILMGVSLYLIWTRGWDKKQVKPAVKLFFVHLVFNALWSILFFGLKAPFLAFLEILVLLALIIGVMIKFYKIDRGAAYLLVPYLLWVIFATFLNFSVWYLNR